MDNKIDQLPSFNEKDERFLEEMEIPLRLSCITTAGWPIIVSLWYIYKDGTLICSSQKSSKMVQFLEQNPRCAFEVANEKPPYRGVRGNGTAALVEDGAIEILEALINRYLGGTDSNLAKYLLSREGEVAIVITPHKIYSWDYSERMRDAVVK